MARIRFTGLIHSISGRIGGDVFSVRKGTAYIKRHAFTQHQSKSQNVQNSRGVLHTLSGKYYSLSTAQKNLWNGYGSLLKNPISGFNAFIKLNMKRSMFLPGLDTLSTPPPTPSTPTHIKNISIALVSSNYFCFFWTDPTTSSQIVLIHYSIFPGRIDKNTHNWKFGLSANSADASCSLNLSYPADTLINFRFKTMDLFGRSSPAYFKNDLQTAEAGVYGSSAYGWAYYN